MFKHALIATDGSELSTRALAIGLSLAKALGAKATIITVTEPRTESLCQIRPSLLRRHRTTIAPSQRLRKRYSRRPKKRQASWKFRLTPCICRTSSAEGILKEAEARGCDVIIMASHGRRAVARALLGGEALRVVTNSPDSSIGLPIGPLHRRRVRRTLPWSG